MTLLDRTRIGVLFQRAGLLKRGLRPLFAGDAQGLARLLERVETGLTGGFHGTGQGAHRILPDPTGTQLRLEFRNGGQRPGILGQHPGTTLGAIQDSGQPRTDPTRRNRKPITLSQ